MGGLIPLLLPSTTGSRTSVIFNPQETPRPSTASLTPATHSGLGHRRQLSLPTPRPARRLSIVTPAALPVLPLTQAEWKRAINEVKRKYVGRKYRTCSARCCEILDNLKDTGDVEPLHLVYIHFYAASSFEMCARPLSQSSSYRTKLLRDAREHYDKATALIQKAEDSTSPRKNRSSSASSTSSLHSPSMSVSSVVSSSTVSTAASSPRNSVSSVDDVAVRRVVPPGAKPKKKKVSFSCLPELVETQKPWEAPSEPFIRPDSPTLGWQEDYFLFGQPEFIPDTVPSIVAAPEVKLAPVQPIIQETPKTPAVDQSPSLPTAVDEEHRHKFDLEEFLQARTANRFCAQLSDLREQISWHRSAIDSLLAAPSDTPDTPAIPDVPAVPALTQSELSPVVDSEPLSPITPLSASLSPATMSFAMSCALKDSFGAASSLDLGLGLPGSSEWASRSRSPSVSSTRPGSAASTVRSAGGGDDALKQRIERLRASGWQRKRFDSRRYEVLREQVLGELGSAA